MDVKELQEELRGALDERRQEILQLYEADKEWGAMSRIARKYGLTRARVQQIIKANQLKEREPGEQEG